MRRLSFYYEQATMRMLIPLRIPLKQLWLQIGEKLGKYGLRLVTWQLFVDKDNNDVELVGEEVTWERVFDLQMELHGESNGFSADIYDEVYGAEATLHLDNERYLSQSEGWSVPMFDAKPDEELWEIAISFFPLVHSPSRELLEHGGRKCCERMTDLFKEMFVEFDGIFGIGGIDERYDEGLDRCFASREWEKLVQGQVLKEVSMVELMEGFHRSYIWFYLLNKERYEASKPYLSDLCFKSIEELPNGGAFLFVNYTFVDYPYVFEQWDDPQPQ